MSKGIHIFRRDLRLYDNVALHTLSKEVDNVIPIFIFDPYQIDKTDENEHYRSDPAVKIMIESLDDLNSELNLNNSKLFYFYGQPSKIIEKLIKNIKPSHISYNADFSKYSIVRDDLIDKVCKDNTVEVIKYMDDNCLNKMELYLNKGSIYKIFGAFYKNGCTVKNRDSVGKPSNFISKKYNIENTYKKDIHLFYSKEHTLLVKGGRTHALKILHNLSKYKEYEHQRDTLVYNTTFLSTYLKFGCVSIVETYDNMKKHKLTPLIRQLYWRQFFFILARFNYNEYSFSDDFFPTVKWRNNVSEAKALWSGNTGYPIIDAGVRQLLQVGYMHNRLRLYVSNFAIKILHHNPFEKNWGGQSQFSKLLIDCCYANNYGNWNNTLGPYDAPGFRYGKLNTKSGRLYDPTSSKKMKEYDPQLEFIRKYIPELSDIPDKDVFNWYKSYSKYPNCKYSKPIVDFEERKQDWFKLTKK
jgi:deoxyribodipyrimidine photo-lyase